MKIIKNVALYILITILLIVTYMTLLQITSLIPSTAMKDNVIKSSETLQKQGEKAFYDLKYKTECIFTFTDALMINTAYSIDNKNPFESFMLARKNYIPGQTKIVYGDSSGNLGANENYKNAQNGDLYQTKELYALMHGEKIEDSYEYSRYWHGYLVFLRPLLLLCDYSVIRVIIFVITIILTLILIYLIYKKINILTAIIYIVGLFSMNLLVVTQSFNEITVYIIAIISSIILLLGYNKIKRYGLFFFIVGSITNYIDLLTAPVITLGITATIYFLLMQKNRENINVKDYIIEVLKIGALWTLGYAITWGIKWILVQVIFNKDIIQQSIEQVIYRIKVPQNEGIMAFDYIDILKRARYFFSENMSHMICVVAILNIIFLTVKNIKKNVNFKTNIVNCIPFIATFLFPMVWYYVLKQHSFIHMFFAYRTLGISVISAIIIINKLFEESKEPIN